MKPGRVLLAAVALAGLTTAGAGVTAVWMDMPQDAVPAQDPVGDLLRDTSRTPLQNPEAPQPAPTSPPAQPGAQPAPIVLDVPEVAAVQEEAPEELEEEAAPSGPTEPVAPGPRQRRPIALVQAVDKITAETMKFEVAVGGRPVRFNNALIVSARACEVSGPGEQTEDSIAYLDISLQPRAAVGGEPRQLFRGWMFASSPSVSSLQHPVYDAWVVGCRA
jgi:hypothetical protein